MTSISSPDRLRLRLHTNSLDHTQNADYDVALYRDHKSIWREKPGVDLAAIELPQEQMRGRFVLSAIAPNFLPPANLVVGAGDAVLIVGYPVGFSDSLHNYPVARTGAIASQYRLAFNGQPYFLADAHLHPGTSGSPVLLKPSPLIPTLETTRVGDFSIFFLGVNSGEVVFPGGSSGLNAIWYADEVEKITAASFQSQVFQQP
jgi:hypothetical protein